MKSRTTSGDSTRKPGPRAPAAPAGRRKVTRLEARLTESQKATLQAAADLRGQTLTEFVVRASEDAAAAVLEQAGVIVLSPTDSAALVEALLNPPAPNAKLRAAAARYEADMGHVVAESPASEPARA